MSSCRVAVWVRVIAWTLLAYLFALSTPLPAQPRLPRIELSPAQARLQAAIANLDVSSVREAIRAGADPNYRYGGRGRSVIGMAGPKVLLGLNERITPETEERLIAIYEVLFEMGARLRGDDRDILHGPAIAGAARVTKYLLERGANPNGDDGDGNTPVILATKYDHPEVVAALVAGGARPLEPSTEAQIRMIAAAGRGDLVAVRRELARGADVNRKGPTGETALVEAVRGGVFRGGNLITVRELLKLGANPNVTGRFISESSPLHAAVFTNEKNFANDNGPAIVEALLKAGAHISSAAFHRKQTRLHVAAHMQNAKAAMLLLKAGAKVMPRDEDGKTPLDLAESSAMIELLKAHGAKEQ